MANTPDVLAHHHMLVVGEHKAPDRLDNFARERVRDREAAGGDDAAVRPLELALGQRLVQGKERCRFRMLHAESRSRIRQVVAGTAHGRTVRVAPRPGLVGRPAPDRRLVCGRRSRDRGSVDADDITAAVAQRLIASQFPHLADLPITPVPESGVDNRTFRLGDELSVRLPAAERYAHQVEKEHRWLPVLTGQLPLPIPEPIAKGEPDHGYPWPWSIYRWFPGATLAAEPVTGMERLASDLGSFLAALHRVDPTGGPPSTDRNWFRANATARDEQTRAAITALDGVIDTRAALEVWDAARSAPPAESPVWIHGDVRAGNLLVDDGRLSAVIDFGCCGLGDPAFDLEIAWDLLSGASRTTFREHLQLDDATWARGRGWKLWATSCALVEGLETEADWVEPLQQIIAEVLSDRN